ncbi:DUF4089 domain-containing protein [Methylobacterium organophilum]|uniref:DUF4089 domain-containing protein n=1 Tax=Methylobacterium organophilum TaxID=410 RepID=A0ABQ4TBW6_METOR|nr:DUF4089 domain-containing protein [Methylobacterium organophilum]GJE29157.1 hypothetical protein LKMONMHP_4036 [Methylobacterium organophilum]
MTDRAEPSFDPEAFATAAADALGIPLTVERIPAVVANLRVLKAAADLVSAFALPDEAETAPVFEA